MVNRRREKFPLFTALLFVKKDCKINCFVI